MQFRDVLSSHKQKLKDFHKRYLVIRVDPDLFKGFFANHHVLFASIGIILILSITVAGFSHLTRASIAKFYPSTCLGGWEHPENVQGEPSLPDGAPASDFSLKNSAHMQSSSDPLFCGGFKGEIPDNTKPTHFKVSLGLSVDDGSVTHPEPEPFTDTPPTEGNISPSDTVPPQPDQNTNTTDTTTPPAGTPPSQATSQDGQGGEDTTPSASSEPAPAPAPANDAPQSFLNNLFSTKVFAQDTTTPPASDQFLEVDYTLDGTTWNVLGYISHSSWQNNSFDIPITEWTNLDNIQIAVKTVPTFDDPSTVYLDNITISVDYDDIEKLLEPPTVLLKDSSNIISSDKDNFSSNETPKFTITNPNLNTDDIKQLINEKKAEVVNDPNGVLDDSKNNPDSLKENLKDTINSLEDKITPSTNPTDTSPTSFLFNSNTAYAADFSNQDITASVVDSNGEEANIVATVETISVDGVEEQQVKIKKPEKQFRPGKYKLKISLNTAQATIVSEQDFTWGVLSVNLNKSTYNLGEDAYIQMGVLNDFGHTICGADLDMTITSPSGGEHNFSTKDKTIIREKQCGPDNVIDVPDYYAHFQIGEDPSEIGTYHLSLTAHTNNGSKIIEDVFNVKEANSLNIERIGPTRIYPVSTYPMTLKVSSVDGWSGTVKEKVPASFEISEPENSTTYDNVEVDPNDSSTKIISWNVSLSAGGEVMLGYRFDAPDISPEFYLLGKADLVGGDNDIDFEEYRNWQIASDASITSNATGTFEATAWPNTLRTGTITSSTLNANITGSGTAFTTEINPGNIIKTTGNVAICTVQSVTDSTHIVCTGNSASSNSGITYNVQGVGPGDAVTLASGFTATLTSNNNTVSSLTLATTSLASQLVINDSRTLTVTGTMTMNAEASAVTQTVTLGSGSGAGSLTVGALTMNGGNAANVGGGKIGCSTSGTGTLTVNGSGLITVNGSSTASNTGSTSIDMSTGACNVITGTVAGTVLTLAGGSTGATPSTIMKMGTGTITMNGNLAFTGSTASKDSFNMGVSGGTLKLNAATLPVVGTPGTYTFTSTTNLTNNSGASTISYATAVTTWGALTVSAGTLNLTAAAETFTGISIANSATLNTTQTITDTGAGASALVCSTGSGSATISGAAGAITMNGASAQLSAGTVGCIVSATGTFTISGATAPQITSSSVFSFVSLTISGPTANNGSTTVTTTLAGASTLTNAATGTLTFGGSSITPTLVTTASGNTVIYNGAAQTIKPNSTYHHLTLSGSGAKTVTSVTTVNGNFSMAGSATATPVITSVLGNVDVSGTAVMTVGANLAITGSLSVGTGSTVTYGAFTTSVGTTTSVTGTLNCPSAATCAGLKTFTGAVTVQSGGLFDLTTSSTVATTLFSAGITQSSNVASSFKTGTGAAQLVGNLAGAGTGLINFGGALTINSGTTSNGYTGGAATVTGLLTFTGGWTQATSSSLTLALTGAATAGAGTFDASTNANTVTYSGAGQTCATVTYKTLTISGSGTFVCATTAVTTLSMTGTETWSTTSNIVVSGAATVGDGTTLTQGNTETFEVDGLFTLGGGTTGTFNCVATASTFTLKGDLTLAVGSFWNKSNCGTLTFSKGAAQVITDNTAGGADLGAVATATASTSVSAATNVRLSTLNIASSTTFDITSKTLTITSNTSQITNSGTFTITSSTISFSSTTGVVVPAMNYYNLTLPQSSADVGSTLGSGTFNIAGNFSAKSGGGSGVVNAETNDPIINVTGNFTIVSGKFSASSTSLFTIGGNFSNSGTFTANSGTVAFDTVGSTSTISGATTFNNLSVTTAAKQVRFTAGTTFAVSGLLTLTGTAGNLVNLNSTTGSSSATINFTGTSSVSYTSATWMACTVSTPVINITNGTDGGNNGLCWSFGGPSITFANSDSSIGFGNFSSLSTTYANGAGTGSITDTNAHTFTITTNAASGYTLTYIGSTLTSGANTISVASGIGTGGTTGTSQFAMSGILTGTGTGAMQTNYNHVTPKWTFVAGTTTTIASSSGAVTSDSIDMRYEANIATSSKAGDYSTTVTFLLTGNF